jgi:Flp pilus assembly pilin Flp
MPSYGDGRDASTTYEYSYTSPFTDSQDSLREGNQGTASFAGETPGDGPGQAAPAYADSAATSYYPGFPAADPGPAGHEGHQPAAATAAGATVSGAAVTGPAVASGSPPGQEAPTYRTFAATAKPKPASPARRAANLVIARLEPWSVMKFSFLMSLVAWIVLFVAVVILYYALSGLGVFAAIQRTISNVTSSQGSAGVSLGKWTSAPRVLGYTMLVGAVNVVLITATSTVGAMIYNLVTHLGGGIEVTLKETE